MEALELAAKLSAHHNNCKGDRCPFASQCNGKKETCGLVDVAMLLRAKEEEIATLRLTVGALRDIILMLQDYTKELEDINGRYRNLVNAFQRGYKPKHKVTHRAGKKPGKPKVSLLEMDGDPRYAMPVEPQEPQTKLEVHG